MLYFDFCNLALVTYNNLLLGEETELFPFQNETEKSTHPSLRIQTSNRKIKISAQPSRIKNKYNIIAQLTCTAKRMIRLSVRKSMFHE